MISRPQQKNEVWRVQAFWTRGMKHQQEILVVCKETGEEADLNFPLFCITENTAQVIQKRLLCLKFLS